MESLVSTDWLARHLGEPDLAVVDSSWFMPATGRSGRDEYLAAHIPGARFLDLDAVSDRAASSPHMLPSAHEFSSAMEKLGVGSRDRIVVYDNSPLRTAARGWFMFRHFGAEQVAILDGGLQKWTAEGRRTESGEPEPKAARWDTEPRPAEVISKAELLEPEAPPILDARGANRFTGTEADPRPGIASGHIPGARNLPYASLYKEDGTFRDISEIREQFTEAGMPPDTAFVASCGSGITANSLIFAAHLLGNDQTRLYDGSWSEWGADPATPKALGPA